MPKLHSVITLVLIFMLAISTLATAYSALRLLTEKTPPAGGLSQEVQSRLYLVTGILWLLCFVLWWILQPAMY